HAACGPHRGHLHRPTGAAGGDVEGDQLHRHEHRARAGACDGRSQGGQHVRADGVEHGRAEPGDAEPRPRARRDEGAPGARVRRTIQTDDAPAPVGPYAQAVLAGELVFLAGQIGIDPATGRLVRGGTREQLVRVLDNLAAVLRATGHELDDVVKTTVYL